MSAEALSIIYYNHMDAGSRGGVRRLCRRAKQRYVPGVKRPSVQDYLNSEQFNTLNKPARRWFIRNHTNVAGIDAKWQAGLADMQGIARQNGEMRYLLTVINVFFKFAWAVPVHSKYAKAITEAFGQVLTTANPRHPHRLQTDINKKFFNSHFQALLKRYGIQHFASESEQKAVVVKRFNRTIKTRIWTCLSDRGTVS